MSDTVCRDCGRRVDLSRIPPTYMPRPGRIQCSRCFGTWLRRVTGKPVTVGSVAKRQAAREAQG